MAIDMRNIPPIFNIEDIFGPPYDTQDLAVSDSPPIDVSRPDGTDITEAVLDVAEHGGRIALRRLGGQRLTDDSVREIEAIVNAQIRLNDLRGVWDEYTNAEGDPDVRAISRRAAPHLRMQAHRRGSHVDIGPDLRDPSCLY